VGNTGGGKTTGPVFAAVMGLTIATGGIAARAAERFPTLTPDQMTPAQRKVADAILAGPRKGLGGPFNTWLRSPELADKLQQVGEHLRFHSSVPPKLNEFAILITARAWDADYEWSAHYPLAIKAGLQPSVAADLASGIRPGAMSPDETAVYDFVTELRRAHRVSDPAYAAAHKVLGDQGIVDLVALSGYYDLVSMTLNTAQVAAPADGPQLPPSSKRAKR
jgi:4-carboxymuconolactone decarboxylase